MGEIQGMGENSVRVVVGLPPSLCFGGDPGGCLPAILSFHSLRSFGLCFSICLESRAFNALEKQSLPAWGRERLKMAGVEDGIRTHDLRNHKSDVLTN